MDTLCRNKMRKGFMYCEPITEATGKRTGDPRLRTFSIKIQVPLLASLVPFLTFLSNDEGSRRSRNFSQGKKIQKNRAESLEKVF